MLRKLIIKVFVVCCVLLSTISLAYAKQITKSHGPIIYRRLTVPQFEQDFQMIMQRWRIPGATVAVMKNGKLIYTQGFGYSDRELSIPMRANNLMRIGSISKTITSAAILQLVQDGKIGLDSKAFDILNDLQPLPGMRVNPGIYNITVRDLLEMSSGWNWKSIGFDPMFGPWPKHVAERLGQIPPSCEQVSQLMMGMPMQFRPGTQFSYSNVNYCMLGLIVDKVTGNNYDSSTYVNYVNSHILHPLGINDMQIAKTSPLDHPLNEAHYYPYYTQSSEQLYMSGLPYSNTKLLENNYADGGWIATAYDLARFAQGLQDYKIVNENMIQQMTAVPSYVPYKNHSQYFAFAWLIKPYDPLMTWSKTGSFTGTNGFVVKQADGTVYAVLFNTRPDEFTLHRFHQLFANIISATNFV